MDLSTNDGNTFISKQDKIEYQLAKYNISEEDIEKTNLRKENIKKKYTQGVYIDKLATKFGDLYKVTIDIDRFKDNIDYEKGKIVFCIKQSKQGNYYPENLQY